MSNIVKIPFNEWSEHALLERGKICTSRTKKYGKEGDFFIVVDRHRIKKILKLPLWFVRDFLYKLEGANNPEEFEIIWKKLHRKKGFVEDQEVYVHFFTNPRTLSCEE